MADKYVAVCDTPPQNHVLQGSYNHPHCETVWYAEVLQEPTTAIENLDPVEIAGFIGAGFFVLLPLWAAVYGGRALISAIRH